MTNKSELLSIRFLTNPQVHRYAIPPSYIPSVLSNLLQIDPLDVAYKSSFT
jgi:hypothetical protein